MLDAAGSYLCALLSSANFLENPVTRPRRKSIEREVGYEEHRRCVRPLDGRHARLVLERPSAPTDGYRNQRWPAGLQGSAGGALRQHGADAYLAWVPAATDRILGGVLNSGHEQRN